MGAELEFSTNFCGRPSIWHLGNGYSLFWSLEISLNMYLPFFSTCNSSKIALTNMVQITCTSCCHVKTAEVLTQYCDILLVKFHKVQGFKFYLNLSVPIHWQQGTSFQCIRKGGLTFYLKLFFIPLTKKTKN